MAAAQRPRKIYCSGHDRVLTWIKISVAAIGRLICLKAPAGRCVILDE
jgi:hypothetical protein